VNHSGLVTLSVTCGSFEEISTGDRRPHHTEEVRDHGSLLHEGASPGGTAIMKTLAIRLDEEQHAQLGMIAKLEDLSVTDAIRQAIEQWIEAKRSNPGLQKRAEAVLAEIEHEAATRRGAISALLSGESASPPTRERPGTGRGRPTKGGDA